MPSEEVRKLGARTRCHNYLTASRQDGRHLEDPLKRLFILLALFSAFAPIGANAESSPIAVSKLFVYQDPRWSMAWTTCISFRNESTRDIQAVKFGFTYVDAFDSPIAQFSGDRVGQFSPGVTIEGPSDPSLSNGSNNTAALNCWRDTQQIASLSSVQVRVLKIRYFGGEVWSNPDATPLFTGAYMVNNPPPARIKCGLFSFGWDYAQHVPACAGVIRNYYAHQAWAPVEATSPQPSPSPN